MCPCIAYCVAEFETVFRGLIFAFFIERQIKIPAKYKCFRVLIDFSLTVKATTIIFIAGRGLAISSAKEGKSGFIYYLVKS